MDTITLVCFFIIFILLHRTISTYRERAEYLSYVADHVAMLRAELVNVGRSQHDKIDHYLFMGKTPRKPVVRQLPLPGFERPHTWEASLITDDTVQLIPDSELEWAWPKGRSN